MELLLILATLVVVVLGMLLVTAVLVLDRTDLSTLRGEFRDRAMMAIPFLGLLGLALGFNSQFRTVAHDISWSIGFRITPLIVRIEGYSVARLQHFFGGEAAWFFSFVYVYGYVFLLVFPLLAYFLLDRLDTFKSLTIAYAANYLIGFVCYVLFVAFGPRNTIPELVGEPLYTTYPHLQLLTSQVNEYTNVFPSLHSSLSATVMYFAWRTREVYPRWTVIAWIVGTSVIIATMYLGIHWIVDVIAGFGLAALSAWIGIRAVQHGWPGRLNPHFVWARLSGEGR